MKITVEKVETFPSMVCFVCFEINCPRKHVQADRQVRFDIRPGNYNICSDECQEKLVKYVKDGKG